MSRKYADIINEGVKAGKSYEEINLDLKAAGATFHLDKDFAVIGWSEAEMAEGFRPGEVADVAHLGDFLARDEAKAGLTIRAITAEGPYDVTYDEGGYAVKALRV